jgi:hypothetical protein
VLHSFNWACAFNVGHQTFNEATEIACRIVVRDERPATAQSHHHPRPFAENYTPPATGVPIADWKRPDRGLWATLRITKAFLAKR